MAQSLVKENTLARDEEGRESVFVMHAPFGEPPGVASEDAVFIETA